MAKKPVDEAWASRLIAQADAAELSRILSRKNYRRETIFWMALKRCDEIALEVPSRGLSAALSLCDFAKTIDSDLFGMSLAVLGSAYRILGKFEESYDCYQQSLDIVVERGLVRGRILQRFAVLKWNINELKAARKAVDSSLELLEGADAAISWVVRSKISVMEGSYQACAEDAGMALKMLSPKKNQQAYLSAVQSLGSAAISGGSSTEDLGMVCRLIRSLKRGRGRRPRSICWEYVDLVEAQIFARLGSHRQAERQLIRVREKLFEAGGEHSREALLVSVDLAVLYEESGEFDRSRKEAESALEIAEAYRFKFEASMIRAHLAKRWLGGLEKEIRGLKRQS